MVAVARKQSYRISSCFPGAVPVLYDGRRDLALDSDNGELSARSNAVPSGLPTREKKPLATGIAAVLIQGPFA
jgi:hypothetical protein